MQQITLQDFEEELKNFSLRPGLLFGPGVTRAPDEMAQKFREVFVGMKAGEFFPESATELDLPQAIDAALESFPEKAVLFRVHLTDKLKQLKPSLDVSKLVTAGWSAYVSLTEDLLLEEALRNYVDGRPASKPVTIVDHFSIEPPPRSYPVFKLLGNLNDASEDRHVCVSESDIQLRKQLWSRMTFGLTNYLRDAPLLVVGFSSSVDRLREVLGIFAVQSSPRINRLRFLKNDPSLQDPTIKAMLKKFNVAIVDADLRELSERVSASTQSRHSTIPVAPGRSAIRLIQDKTNYYDCPVLIVPQASSQPIDLPAMERAAAIDGLFRPSATDWRAFQANLDLRRDCEQDIVASISAQLSMARVKEPRVVMMIGDSGVGKTTLAKRIALQMSMGQTLVLWCRRVASGGWVRQFRKWLDETLHELHESYPDHFRNLLIFCDDPWAHRIEASDALAALESASLPAVLVVTLRGTDRYVTELQSTTASNRAHKEVDVPYEVSSSELGRMSQMLLGIGAVTSLEQGEKTVKSLGTKISRDILCSLWYLVPETKSQLADSLKDEYFRLGESSSIRDLAQSSLSSGAVAHKAYEFVTVSSRLGIGLPVELLVHALEIDYSDWINSLSNGRPLWGLLYDDLSPDGSTLIYFTRNEVVTRVLIDLVNGGIAGHMGELRVLKELIKACHPYTTPYRNFVLDVLVRARGRLADIFSYEQGCELYEAALLMLPQEDRLLEHHYGIWIQDTGPKDGSAYKQLEKALKAASHNGSERDAPREHIHASMAAATLQEIRAGSVEWTGGAELVRHHIGLAASATFFNAHTSHVSANLLFEAAQLAKQRSDQETATQFTVAAFQEIEKAFHTIGARASSSFQYSKTIGMLDDLQGKILGLIPHFDELQQVAIQLFQAKRWQGGFELAGRRLLAEASKSGKGKDYNALNAYIGSCISLVEQAGVRPSAALLAIRVECVIRWKIHGFKEVDWPAFKADLLAALEQEKFSDDVLKRFYLAVAYFHTNEMGEANAAFAQLRRNSSTNHRPNDIRAFFQDAHGNPRRFQGAARFVGARAMISIAELQVDAPLRIGAQSAVGLRHVYIGFSFNGMVAVEDAPSSDDLQLS